MGVEILWLVFANPSVEIEIIVQEWLCKGRAEFEILGSCQAVIFFKPAEQLVYI